ncbi:MAG: sulfite exporter TauE/SafE family protein [Clostridiales bacterium]|jgi:uncharacterized membrane protein YfcA|nr:sulfite exporter TauE/SafE family protein [Clostridiales bacterium]
MNVIFLILIGVAAGALSGMGIGGGAVLIPALTLIFGQSQHAAQNINLVYFIPTAAFAVAIHAKGGQIQKEILPKLIMGGIIGAVAGALIALNLEADTLRQIFAIFLLVMGFSEFFKKVEKRG